MKFSNTDSPPSTQESAIHFRGFSQRWKYFIFELVLDEI